VQLEGPITMCLYACISSPFICRTSARSARVHACLCVRCFALRVQVAGVSDAGLKPRKVARVAVLGGGLTRMLNQCLIHVWLLRVHCACRLLV
jgi:hypothetical protein